MRTALSIAALLLSLAPSTAAQQAAGSTLWRAETRNNICGVSNPRHVTNPAVVDYTEVLSATPEMRDMGNRDIDPRSAEGQILRQRAVDHVRRVGSKVMRRNGHCSMWKEINHRAGRKASDLTGQLVAALSMSTVSMSSGGVIAGEVYAGEGDAETVPSAAPTWAIPALIGVLLAAGWLGIRRRSGGSAGKS